jgi:hypothetical protein
VPNLHGVSGQVTRYDVTGSFTDNRSWDFYDTEAQNSKSKQFFGAVFDGRYIYFVPEGGVYPAYDGQVTRYDTTGNNASGCASIPTVADIQCLITGS